ncbi:Putative oxidoreductase SadH [Pirellulimonas nuda]|uniref:Oxidoreductase SadH n=1 Tax=Pirellulimonas nuda TaxID=2528009 RepID=A0A518DB05_9BACT|nr:SDR family oxidoreductase [Pirellulimonas nuda]QDU88606.1 Putative oxidoreductase SadH [Pirellulimonas nuda]
MRKIAGKRALVTGAASGIGRAIALRLAGEGARLFLVDIDRTSLAAVVEDARRLGVEAEGRVCDVADRNQITRVTQEAIERWAGVDILVNNVGVSYRGLTHEMPPEEVDRLLAINLHSHLQFTRELLPTLLLRQQAHILNVCSVLGLVGMPRVSVYCATKFALKGYSESLRAEYGRLGLGVTTLCPGFVETNLFKNAHTATPKQHVKPPPGYMCTTADRVARAAISGIKRNRDVVLVEWFARALHLWKRFSPFTMDAALRWGWRRRVRRGVKHGYKLSSDQPETIREWARAQAAQLESERNAA